MRNIFKEASILNWERYHHKIIEANETRLNYKEKKEKQLGYTGDYRHRWGELFRKAYNNVITNDNKLLKHFEQYENKMESIYIKMIKNFMRCEKYRGDFYVKIGKKIKHVLNVNITNVWEKQRNKCMKKGKKKAFIKVIPLKTKVIVN